MDWSRFDRAIALREAGDLNRALDELRSLRESTKDRQEIASLLLNEISCLLLLGDKATARRAIDQAKSLRPTLADCCVRLKFLEARVCVLENDHKAALRLIEDVLHSYSKVLAEPEYRELYEEIVAQKGIVLAELGRYREAAPLLEQATSFDILWKATAYFYLALCRFNLDDMEDALRWFKRALELGFPDDLEVAAHSYLGVINFKKGAYAQALQEFHACERHEAQEHVPRLEIRKWLAETYQALGLEEEAARYRRLVEEENS